MGIGGIFFFFFLVGMEKKASLQNLLFSYVRMVVLVFSHVCLFVTLWTVVHQAPLSMGFSRQEYWRGLPCPSLGDLPDQGLSLNLQCPLHCRWILHHWSIREASHVRQGVWVWSLVGELRSHMPYGATKKKKKSSSVSWNLSQT